jgi:hypothetical protein
VLKALAEIAIELATYYLDYIIPMALFIAFIIWAAGK